MARLLVTISVTLNLLLLTTLVAARVDVARSRPADDGDSPVPEIGRLDDVLESSTTVGELYASLRAAGLEHGVTAALIGAWVARGQALAMRAETGAYWLASDGPAEAARLERFEQETAMRRELVSLFGEGVVHDPYLLMLFEPLGARFAFLSSDEQVRLQRALAVAGTGAVMHEARDCEAGAGSESDAPARPQVMPGDEVLGAAAAFEYGLRASPFATQLRLAELGLAEAEFRDAFGLMTELGRASTLADHARARRALVELLGESGFDRVWSQRDPLYQEVRRALEPRGAAPHVIESAYAVMNRSQERLLDVAQRTGDPERLGELSRGIVEEERSELESLVGVTGTRRLVEARAGLAATARPQSRCPVAAFGTGR